MINNFFQQFNKNPEKENWLVNFYLTELQEYTNSEIQQGISMLINSADKFGFPKDWELKRHIDALEQKQEPKAVPCFICGSFGWVMNVIGTKSGERIKPMTFKCKPVEGFHYQTMVDGRCKCINGERLGEGIEFGEPIPDVLAKAKVEKRDCVNVADKWAWELNGREPIVPSPQIIAQCKVFMKRCEEQHNRASEVKSAGELFAEQIDALTIGVEDGKSI